MNFKILNSSTNKIINRSNVRLANDNRHLSLRANPVTSPEVIKSLREDKLEAEDPASETSSNNEDPGSKTSTNDSSSPSSSVRPMPVFDPNDIMGRKLLLDKECGQRLRYRIVKALDDLKAI